MYAALQPLTTDVITPRNQTNQEPVAKETSQTSNWDHPTNNCYVITLSTVPTRDCPNIQTTYRNTESVELSAYELYSTS